MTWYEWIELIGECVIIAVPAVMLITWRIRSNRRLLQQEIPGQLVQLVQLAHGASRVRTIFDIRVSERMRDALCAPLTQEQLATIRSAAPGTYSTYVKCELLSSSYKGSELSGVVKAAVRVSSKFSEEPLICPEVQLKITVCGMDAPGMGLRWEVTSVERMA